MRLVAKNYSEFIENGGIFKNIAGFFINSTCLCRESNHDQIQKSRQMSPHPNGFTYNLR